MAIDLRLRIAADPIHADTAFIVEGVLFEKLLQCLLRKKVTQELPGLRLGTDWSLMRHNRNHQPPRTGGINSVSAFGLNFRWNVFFPSVMSTAKKPCCILALNSASIASSRCGLIVSTSHSASVSSPLPLSIRIVLTAMFFLL